MVGLKMAENGRKWQKMAVKKLSCNTHRRFSAKVNFLTSVSYDSQKSDVDNSKRRRIMEDGVCKATLNSQHAVDGV